MDSLVLLKLILPVFRALNILLLLVNAISSKGQTTVIPKKVSVYAFTNVNVIAMKDSSVIPDQTVLVNKDRIIAIGNSKEIELPPHTIQIDGKEKFLLPGICDMHMHLPYSDNDTSAIPSILISYIANGVTTILNLLGIPFHLNIREQVNRNIIPGPTIYTSGFYINEPYIKTPHQVDSAVITQKNAGYDVLRFHSPLSVAAYHQLNISAQREKMLLIGHLPRNLGLSVALDEGQPVIAHAEEFISAYFLFNNRPLNTRELFDSLLNDLVDILHEKKTIVMPTLTVYKNIVGQISNIDSVLNLPVMRYAPKEIYETFKPENNIYTSKKFRKQDIPVYENIYSILSAVTKKLNDKGVRLVFGTDAPVSAQIPGFSVYDEMNTLVSAGLSPYEIILSATRNAAEMLGKSEEFGTIETGKRADLILLNSNPLVSISNMKNKEGVMVRGKWYSVKDIENILTQLEVRHND